MVTVAVSRRMPAPPEVVWAVIGDPHRYVTTLPSTVGQVEVRSAGEIACVVSAMGVSEPMVMRRTRLDPPRLLVEERVDGRRAGRTTFAITDDGGGSRVTLTSEVGLTGLAARMARGAIERGLGEQLANLDRISSSGIPA